MKSVICIILIFCGVSAFAAPTAYELKEDHTDVTFRISHAGFTMKHGSFARMTGTLSLDADHLETSAVDVTVVINSIATNHANRDSDLQSAKWLDADHYPVMHFVSTMVTHSGTDKIDVVGSLTLHGVTKPLVLHATVNRVGASPFGNAQTAGFTAIGTLKRSDYGITQLLPLIGDDVAIEIDVEFGVPKTS